MPLRICTSCRIAARRSQRHLRYYYSRSTIPLHTTVSTKSSGRPRDKITNDQLFIVLLFFLCPHSSRPRTLPVLDLVCTRSSVLCNLLEITSSTLTASQPIQLPFLDNVERHTHNLATRSPIVLFSACVRCSLHECVPNPRIPSPRPRCTNGHKHVHCTVCRHTRSPSCRRLCVLASLAAAFQRAHSPHLRYLKDRDPHRLSTSPIPPFALLFSHLSISQPRRQSVNSSSNLQVSTKCSRLELAVDCLRPSPHPFIYRAQASAKEHKLLQRTKHRECPPH